MTGEYLKNLRKKTLKVSRRVLGEYIGSNGRTIESWEQGRRPIPLMAEMFITEITHKLTSEQGETTHELVR